MKETICTALGALGSVIAGFFGGWDASIITLIVFMGIDYITGL
ncbi:MAG: phage holin family protein, partial [Ruminococcus sp.]|nr:phage holin family protein [Ruminococcus sp.]MBQ8688332.1 phage holin family protein [Ruminococcus sp.]